MILLLILILAAPLGATTVFTDAPTEGASAGEMGPGMVIMDDKGYSGQLDDEYDQTVQLHKGWNLVSWHIWPSGVPEIYQTIAQMLPDDGPHSWFHENPGGKVFLYWSNTQWWPDWQTIGDQDWNVHHAYYFDMNGPHTWNEYVNKPPVWPNSNDIDVTPSSAWAHDQNVGEPGISYWFFMGFSAPGYCKLASIPANPNQSPEYGNPANYSFEGPFHNLIWHDTNPWELYALKIVRDDEGHVYIPDPTPSTHRRPSYDNIGMLQPGKGYFLGFDTDGQTEYTFDGWEDWPMWQNNSYEPPSPPGAPPSICSANHFEFNAHTHWSYPVFIDTVDLAECPMEAGDEIGVFDGDLCVGSARYEGAFPLVVVCWEDDIATPDSVDGYGDGNPMIFKWFNASENCEMEFELPPGIQAMADSRVAPTHSGFGIGLFALRDFMQGVSATVQLPQQFRIRQNYPNPFNSETIIPIELPQRSHVKVELFDLMGRDLGSVYDGTNEAGWPRIRINAGELSSGIYFYRITADGLEHSQRYADVAKMLLLK